MAGHQQLGLRPDGGERALRVVAANRPGGGPQRLRDRPHAAGRGVLVERGHQFAVRPELVPAHPRDDALDALARSSSSPPCRPAPRRSRPGRQPLAARRRRRAPRLAPTRCDERGVHEQGLPRLDAEFPQVADEPLARHGRGTASVRSSRLGRGSLTIAAAVPSRRGGPRPTAAPPRRRRRPPARPARARRWRASARPLGRRDPSARPSRPASRSPRR